MSYLHKMKEILRDKDLSAEERLKVTEEFINKALDEDLAERSVQRKTQNYFFLKSAESCLFGFMVGEIANIVILLAFGDTVADKLLGDFFNVPAQYGTLALAGAYTVSAVTGYWLYKLLGLFVPWGVIGVMLKDFGPFALAMVSAPLAIYMMCKRCSKKNCDGCDTFFIITILLMIIELSVSLIILNKNPLLIIPGAVQLASLISLGLFAWFRNARKRYQEAQQA